MRHDAFIFLQLDGSQLDSSQRAFLETFIGSGKGFLGVGLACSTQQSSPWPWYNTLIGATCTRDASAFLQAPSTMAIISDDRAHPSSYFLPERWTAKDRWPRPDSLVRRHNHVLATLVPTMTDAARTFTDRPVSWCKMFGAGSRVGCCPFLEHFPDGFS